MAIIPGVIGDMAIITRIISSNELLVAGRGLRVGRLLLPVIELLNWVLPGLVWLRTHHEGPSAATPQPKFAIYPTKHALNHVEGGQSLQRRNSKFEIRNSKQFQMFKKHKIPNKLISGSEVLIRI